MADGQEVRSSTLGELAKALGALQAKLAPVPRESTNPFYKHKYADLAAVWRSCHKLLAEHGLAVTQTCRLEDSDTVLVTTLLHSSGEWVSGSYRLTPVKANDPQAMGSAMTYARRYTLMGLLGLVAEGEDDDAESAVQGRQSQSGQSPPPKATGARPKLWCSEHKTVWFKKGKMRGFAHPIGDTGQWCNAPEAETPPEPQESPSEPPSEVDHGPEAEDSGPVAQAKAQGISLTQRQRMFALAQEHGVTEPMLRGYLKQLHNLDSTKDMTREQYEAVCDWLQQQGKGSY